MDFKHFRPWIGIGWKRKMGVTFVFKYQAWCIKYSAFKGKFFILIHVPTKSGYFGTMNYFIGFSKRQ